MEGEPTFSIGQVAGRAGVDEGYVRRLEELGAVRSANGAFRERDVHTVALYSMWERAGLDAGVILDALSAGTLSLEFLDAPAWELPEPLPETYREVAAREGVPVEILEKIQVAMGFAAPEPDDRVAPDDLPLVELVRLLRHYDASSEGIGRLFATYSDNIRRLALAEADLYVEQLERRWARAGAGEAELMERGAELGRRLVGPVDGTIRAIYRRHRRHIWAQHSISRAELALEKAGLLERVVSTPAICFVDMTGYTRLTEEEGDEEAARLAGALGELVNRISQIHGGRAIRWLGDGGMFYFEDSGAAFAAALEMSERAPAAGLPPTHIGIQAGPVIFRDGDVYGRTVNIASRIADEAGADEVLTSAETVDKVADGSPGVTFEPARRVELHGVAEPVMLYRVLRPG